MANKKCKGFCGRIRAPTLIVAVAVAIAGCEGKSITLGSGDTLTTASTAPASLKETAALGQRWRKDPGDTRLGLAYASSLKSLGQTQQQSEVLKTLVERHPGDQQLMVIYGKQLVETGQGAQGAGILEQAIAAGNSDWKTYSALGSALDQQGKYAEARGKYEQALILAPNQITVLNNLGMSFALEGNLTRAEATLRQANELPTGRTEPRIRQNLALVVGLQGRFDEARKIASEDLPADQVEANMAYLQKMLSQPNTWQQLQQSPPGQG
jgi:Flp pilus assembly protein TadD